jgi:hypothetical protein
MSAIARQHALLILSSMCLSVSLAAECPLPCNTACGCFYATEQDMANAKKLQQQFQCEAQHLHEQYPAPLTRAQLDSSRQEFSSFVAQLKSYPLPLPACVDGPADQSADYSPRDFRVETLQSAHPPPLAQQCQRSPGSQQELTQAMHNCKCSGMSQAIQVHEDYHQQQCVAAGGTLHYNEKSGAEEADEEVEAYGRQISALNEAREAGRSGGYNAMKCLVFGHDGMKSKEGAASMNACLADWKPLPGPCPAAKSPANPAPDPQKSQP